jgi:hypothetical protein
MKISEKIIPLFSQKADTFHYEENNSEHSFSCKLVEAIEPSKGSLQELSNYLSSRDTLRLSIEFDNSGSDIHLLRGEEEGFLADYSSKLSFLDENDEHPILKVKIEKVSSDDCISVYDFNELINFWSKDGLVSSFSKIQDMNQRGRILCVLDLGYELETNLFKFVDGLEPHNAEFNQFVERDSILSKREKVCHFANSANYYLIPEDFNIKDQDAPEELIGLFSRLKLLTSLIFICDLTRIEEAQISFRLNGYRLLSKELNACEYFEPSSSDEFYEIYKWIYGDGELIDKVGLARNLISLHLSDEDLFHIHDGTLQSITSGYQIYLKENVKQYIEIKNKVSEFIQASSDKASEIAKNIGSYYRNSIWSLYSFFFSIFLIRAFINSEKNLITSEVLYFYIAFVVLALLAMSYALKELEQDKERLEEGYKSLKNRYKDLLLSDDLDKILDYDKQHKADIRYIEKKKSQYRILWGGSLGVLSVIIGILWLAGSH